jgi:hypothetical protein
MGVFPVGIFSTGHWPFKAADVNRFIYHGDKFTGFKGYL